MKELLDDLPFQRWTFFISHVEKMLTKRLEEIVMLKCVKLSLNVVLDVGLVLCQ